MSRSTYDVKEKYTGDGSLSAYTFDFKIEALTQLLIIELDDLNVETQRVLGDDVVYLSSVDYDAIDGAGTVNLVANLPTGYTLVILLANDAPTQPYEFTNKGTFSLKLFERALDFVCGAVQRLTYRGKQALRIHDNDDEETFNCQFPTMEAITQDGRYLKVNDTGDGFDYGFTEVELVGLAMPLPTTVNEVVKWDGSAWVADLYGGGRVTSAIQNIAAGGDITTNAGIQQLLKIQSTGGVVTCSISPFLGTLQDGMVITLVGLSDVNQVMIPYNDGVDGCLLKGNRYLGRGDTLTLVYDIAERRFFETARN